VSSASAALSFSATGLPPGLKISSAGLVTGVPTTTGTSHVAVAVDDAKGAYRAASFSWAVTTATGHLKGDHGLCARLNRSSTASGTKVVIWSCYTTASEQWTLGSGGALSAGGKCLTDPHSGGPGTGLVIEPCARASSQQWWRTLKGQYVLALNHLCLTDPGASTTAGTELKLGACITGSADVWSVP
ncbi:MAG TPA: ricin-type beta-trefoil lectin domain protein, partial [Streptosporangiaceae bacterium]